MNSCLWHFNIFITVFIDKPCCDSESSWGIALTCASQPSRGKTGQAYPSRISHGTGTNMFSFPRWFFSPTFPMLIHAYPFSEGPLAMWNFEGPIPYATFLPQSCGKIWRAAASGSFHGSPLKWGWISGCSFRNSCATLPETHRRVGGLLMAQNWPTIQGREPRRLSCWNHLASPGELIWLGERAPCPLLCVATGSHPILAHWCDCQTPWPWFATYVLTNISRTIN